MGHRGRKKVNLLLVVLIAIVSLVAFNFGQKFTVNQKSASAADWYSYNWQYRTKITVNHAKVSSDQTAFPVLVSSTVNDWRTIADGGHVGQNLGQDFVFVASDQTTKLPHEIESYDNTSGKLVAWVKTNLSSTVDTNIYLYYGNAGCTDQQDKTTVWSDYLGAWHFSDGSGTTASDSTTNALNITVPAGVLSTNGQTGGGIVYNGDAAGTYPLANHSFGNIYVSFWAKLPAVPTDSLMFPYQAHGWMGDDTKGFSVGWREWSYHTQFMMKIRTPLGDFDGAAFTSDQQWHLYSYQITPGGAVKSWKDGALDINDSVASFTTAITVNPNFLGDPPSGAFTGSLDEVRIIDGAAKTADWITTEFNNQNSPASFYSLAATEQGDTTPPINPSTFNGYDTAGKATSIASGDWHNYPAPYFEWSGASDPESGAKGYYVYFGTDSAANPVTAGTFQAHSGVSGAIQSYTSPATLNTGSTYYLRLRSENNSVAPYNLADAATLFTYKFDNVAPNAPEYVNVSPVGCSAQTSFTFNWPVATDSGGSDFKTYQYRRGTTGTITDVADTTLQAFAYQDGDNVLYVRTEDNAGNFSSWQTSVFCSTAAIQVISGPDVAAGPSSITATWVSSKATTGYVKVYDGNTYISEQGLTNYSLSHTVKVIGLVPEKQYRYQITWTDQSGNLGESDWYTTSTATAPQINNLAAQIISPTSINVSWNSTIPAEFNLEYGIGNYGTTIPSTVFLNGYSGKIDGLSSGVTYQFRVDATGQDGTKFFAGQSVAMPPLPSIGALKFQSIANRPDTAITVSWTTNTEITSSVFYGPVGAAKTEVSTSDKVKDHKIDIGNLSDNSDYEIYATGIDQFGNVAKSATETFKTAYDTRPPVMANISTESSNIGTSSNSTAQITVGLTTDEPAKCMLEYGTGISGATYSGRTTDDEIFETNHIAVIAGLKPQSPYHFRINCSDKSGNKATSSDQTVISGEITQSVFNIIIKTLNNLFGWMGTKL